MRRPLRTLVVLVAAAVLLVVGGVAFYLVVLRDDPPERVALRPESEAPDAGGDAGAGPGGRWVVRTGDDSFVGYRVRETFAGLSVASDAVGRTHDVKGQAVAAFVTLREGSHGSPELLEELRAHVGKKIGAIAKPDDIIFTADLPKTRSGKIMRRLLRDIAEGRALGDVSTLADPAVVALLKSKYEEDSA